MWHKGIDSTTMDKKLVLTYAVTVFSKFCNFPKIMLTTFDVFFYDKTPNESPQRFIEETGLKP